MTSSDVTVPLAIVLIVYVALMFGISFWAKGKIENEADFLVAGRRLPLGLSFATLFATWFGAGTLLTATDEVRAGGLEKAALDPFGAGACLIIAGLFYARPLYRMKLLTVADYFRERFGPRAELLSSILMVPGYTGWIAAQFVALAGVLNLFFGIPVEVGILLVAIIGTGYTMLGGMWSVTLTDALQMAILIVGIVALGWVTFDTLGDGSVAAGAGHLVGRMPGEKLALVPTEDLPKLVTWLGVFCAGALGNIPGQDLMQRVFASKSETTAQRACVLAGIAYLTIGAVPLLTGLAGSLLFPEVTETILPFLAHELLTPTFAVIFLLAVTSAVLSTIDSAILAPASVLAQNILARTNQKRFTALQLSHIAVVLVAVSSLLLAYAGESAYALLETAYEVGLVSLLVPLTLGLYVKAASEPAALAAMITGTAIWLLHVVLDWGYLLDPLVTGTPLLIPAGIGSAAISVAGYFVMLRRRPASEAAPS